MEGGAGARARSRHLRSRAGRGNVTSPSFEERPRISYVGRVRVKIRDRWFRRVLPQKPPSELLKMDILSLFNNEICIIVFIELLIDNKFCSIPIDRFHLWNYYLQATICLFKKLEKLFALILNSKIK